MMIATEEVKLGGGLIGDGLIEDSFADDNDEDDRGDTNPIVRTWSDVNAVT